MRPSKIEKLFCMLLSPILKTAPYNNSSSKRTLFCRVVEIQGRGTKNRFEPAGPGDRRSRFELADIKTELLDVILTIRAPIRPLAKAEQMSCRESPRTTSYCPVLHGKRIKADRCNLVRDEAGVNTDHSAFQPLGCSPNATDIATIEVARQTKFGIVGTLLVLTKKITDFFHYYTLDVAWPDPSLDNCGNIDIHLNVWLTAGILKN